MKPRLDKATITQEQKPDDQKVEESEESMLADTEKGNDVGWSVVQRNGKSSVPNGNDISISPPSRVLLADGKGSSSFSPSRFDALHTITEDDEEEVEIKTSGEDTQKSETDDANFIKKKPISGGGNRSRTKSYKKQLFNRVVSNNFPKENKNKKASSGKH